MRGAGSENDINIYRFVSPKFAIMGAVDDLGMGHYLQSREDSLVRWAGEANELIVKDTKAQTIYRPVPQVAYTCNSRVKLCDGFVALQCLKLNGCKINYLYQHDWCANNCENGCGTGVVASCCGGTPGNGYYQCVQFTIEGCWVKFFPDVPDGLKVEIQAWAIPYDEEGYVMVIDKTILAMQSYIKAAICHREGDRREGVNKQDWLYRVRQARASINKKTDSEMRAISQWWAPRHFIIGNHYRPYGG